MRDGLDMEDRTVVNIEISGRFASGKSTLANYIASKLHDIGIIGVQLVDEGAQVSADDLKNLDRLGKEINVKIHVKETDKLF